MTTPPKTGWPAPELAQDDHRGLFRWFASKPDARERVREALPSCCEFHGMDECGCNQGQACPERARRAAADQDEPLTDPNYMLTLAAVWGIAAVAVIVGGLLWLITHVWPVVAAYINR